MCDLQKILVACDQLEGSSTRAALATVVEVEGSAYRRAGARLLMAEDGRTWGGISGGCLEADVVMRGRQAMDDGKAILCCYDTRSDADLFFGLGLGCNGLIKILVEPIVRFDLLGLRSLGHCLSRRQTMVQAMVYSSPHPLLPVGARCALMCDGWIEEFSGAPQSLIEALRNEMCRTLGGESRSVQLPTDHGLVSVFLELLRPVPALAIFGAGFDAVPLVRGANELGWQVTVADHRSANAQPDRFPGAHRVDLCDGPTAVERADLDKRSAALLMTHSYLDDREVLPMLLKSSAAFVGLLGPRRRTERLLRDLAVEGWNFTDAELARLHAPVGLDIGAQVPEEIALAVLAEIQAAFAGRSGGFLRDRATAIHEAEVGG